MPQKRYEIILGKIFSKFQEKQAIKDSLEKIEYEFESHQKALQSLQRRKKKIIEEATRKINKNINEQHNIMNNINSRLDTLDRHYQDKYKEYDELVGGYAKKFSTLARFRPKKNPYADKKRRIKN